MNELMEKLHDIEGIDPISLWPLSIGWWVVIVCSFFFIMCCVYLFWRQQRYKNSWKYDALLQLQALQKNMANKSTYESAILLSEYLRRIAIRRYSRAECAGLSGNYWLQWLSAHDPRKFDWEKKGRFLIEAPYAPAMMAISQDEINEAICAAKRWLR
jgi:hypothetical protein